MSNLKQIVSAAKIQIHCPMISEDKVEWAQDILAQFLKVHVNGHFSGNFSGHFSGRKIGYL